MWTRHVDTGSVDRKDVKRDCTKALQPNIREFMKQQRQRQR